MAHDGTLYAVAARGFYTSRDLGESWKRLRDLPAAANALEIDGEDVWLAGDRGLCARYRPSDGSLSDFSIPADWGDRAPDLYGLAIGFGHRIALGQKFHIYVSAADTHHWERVPLWTPTGYLADIDFSPDGTAFIVGGDPATISLSHPLGASRLALKSKDYRTWRNVELPSE